MFPVVRGAALGVAEYGVRVPKFFEAALVDRLRVIGMVQGGKETEGLVISG
jgi:hypothetical protein